MSDINAQTRPSLYKTQYVNSRGRIWKWERTRCMLQQQGGRFQWEAWSRRRRKPLSPHYRRLMFESHIYFTIFLNNMKIAAKIDGNNMIKFVSNIKERVQRLRRIWAKSLDRTKCIPHATLFTKSSEGVELVNHQFSDKFWKQLLTFLALKKALS